MSSRKKIPLAIYELPLDQKKVIATTFLAAQFFSELFDAAVKTPEDADRRKDLEDTLVELITFHLCHNGMISELRVNLILLKMLTAAKKVD
jgi:hypothetical protein